MKYLRVGSSGFKVGIINLILLGKWSNYFSYSTRDAVFKFQKDNRISIDGIVGPITFNKLLIEAKLLTNNKIKNTTHTVKKVTTKAPKYPNTPPSLSDIKIALNLLFYGHNKEVLEKFLDESYPLFNKLGINSKNDFIMAFGQFREEVGPRIQITESFNYSVNALVATFSYYQKHKNEAYLDGRRTGVRADEKVIACKVYANRLGNRDVESGDGWHYRGKSFGQVTGRFNVRAVDKLFVKLKIKNICGTFEQVPDCRNKYKYAIVIGLAFWFDKKCFLHTGAITEENINKITRIFNKHTSSYKQRVKHTFKLAKIMEKM